MAFTQALLSLLIAGTLAAAQDYSAPGLNVSMAVISDPHFYDPSLGTSGKSFDRVLNSDGKLIRESSELLDAALANILSSNASIVLIPGDLTKDGALRSHLGMASRLEILNRSGVKVFVVPGNHDVNNSRAYSFQGDQAQRVPNVDQHEFSEIYGPYGYDEAIFSDSASLSYIAEPMEGLWIIGLDACLYKNNDTIAHSETGGALGKEQRRWLESILLTEEAASKTKIAIMHHGLLEHYRTQKKHFGNYVVKAHKKRSRWLASLGVQTVFTGHYHADDITLQEWNDGSFLFDIETGSLVTYPCPIRKVRIGGDSMVISTEHIQTIPSMEKDLQEYARRSVSQGASKIASTTMTNWWLNPEDAHYLANQLGTLFSEHCLGDEPGRYPAITVDGVSFWGRTMIFFRKRFIWGLANDLPPSDNSLIIHLQTGKYDTFNHSF
jgi:3',5'-cyclic AMP phosphodiesterase CpdA